MGEPCSGLYTGHAYSILKAVEYRGKRFLRIRNPWGNSECELAHCITSTHSPTHLLLPRTTWQGQDGGPMAQKNGRPSGLMR